MGFEQPPTYPVAPVEAPTKQPESVSDKKLRSNAGFKARIAGILAAAGLLAGAPKEAAAEPAPAPAAAPSESGAVTVHREIASDSPEGARILAERDHLRSERAAEQKYTAGTVSKVFYGPSGLVGSKANTNNSLKLELEQADADGGRLLDAINVHAESPTERDAKVGEKFKTRAETAITGLALSTPELTQQYQEWLRGVDQQLSQHFSDQVGKFRAAKDNHQPTVDAEGKPVGLSVQSPVAEWVSQAMSELMVQKVGQQLSGIKDGVDQLRVRAALGELLSTRLEAAIYQACAWNQELLGEVTGNLEYNHKKALENQGKTDRANGEKVGAQVP